MTLRTKPRRMTPAEDDDGVDVAAEAQQLDQRLAGWRYRIASYQFDQMTRRMDDLLRDLPGGTGGGRVTALHRVGH